MEHRRARWAPADFGQFGEADAGPVHVVDDPTGNRTWKSWVSLVAGKASRSRTLSWRGRSTMPLTVTCVGRR